MLTFHSPARNRFFHSGGCGCLPVAQTGCSSPVYPASGAIIADARYFSLTTGTNGQMIIVPKGSNAQMFLKGTTGQRGFVFYENEVVGIQGEPALTLPLHNPAVSGAFPQPAGFKYITIGNGADPTAWRHVAAPSAGSWVLQVIGGQWVLVDAGQIPGINAVGISATFAAKGNLLALVEVSPGIFTVQKLLVNHGRVLVGDVDAGTGVVGYKPLAVSAALVHPIGKFQDGRIGTLTTLDGAGVEIVGGLEQAVVTGIGAVTDGVVMLYSPTTKRIYRAPAHTHVFVQVLADSASTVPPGSYTAMPGGHGAGSSETYNYESVRVDFQMRTSADERYQLGLFRDGVLVKEFDNFSFLETFGFFYTEEGVVPGAHTYDVRWKKTAGTNAAIIKQSIFNVSTLP